MITVSKLRPAIVGRSRARVPIFPHHRLRRVRHLYRRCAVGPPVVLAQRQIPSKTNEIPMVAELVEDLRAARFDRRWWCSPSTRCTPSEAQQATAALLAGAGAAYVMTVKGNQPGLQAPSSPFGPASRWSARLAHRARPRPGGTGGADMPGRGGPPGRANPPRLPGPHRRRQLPSRRPVPDCAGRAALVPGGERRRARRFGGFFWPCGAPLRR